MTEVKICGLMRPQDIRAARQADYLGFVVATGTRRSLQPSAAKDLMSLTDRPTVVVTTSSDGAFIKYLAADLRPFAIQLNGSMDGRLIEEVRSGVRCELWATVHVGTEMPHLDPATLSLVDKVVIDTANPQGGGAGQVHDHRISAALVRELRPCTVLAGGLTPENVGTAIERVRPSMVDVSTGVETDGAKDPLKIGRFIEAVRGCR
jgi:phosphoribosylanthranilate isomerase